MKEQPSEEKGSGQRGVFQILTLAGLFLALCACAFGRFTSTKLYDMAQIRGFVEGAEARTYVIREKYHAQGSSAYWVSWRPGDIQEPGVHRISVSRSQWSEYEVGDSVELVFIPQDAMPYLRDGIYASDGNIVFDMILLTMELGVVLVGLVLALFGAFRLRRATSTNGRSP